MFPSSITKISSFFPLLLILCKAVSSSPPFPPKKSLDFDFQPSVAPSATIQTPEPSLHQQQSWDIDLPDPTPQPTPVIIQTYCPFNVDPIWQVVWPPAQPGTFSVKKCPSGFQGKIKRFCRFIGIWAKPDISMCIGNGVEDLESQANTFFMGGSMDVDGAVFLINQLANLTRLPPRDGGQGKGFLLSKSELRTINFVVREALDVLKSSQQGGGGDQAEDLVDLLDNSLDSRNKESWRTLQDSESGSEELLSNAELYAVYLGRTLNSSNAISTFSRDNLAIRASRIGFGEGLEDNVFPLEGDVVNSTVVDQASIKIPSRYLEAFADIENGDINVVHMFFPTLQEFLPTTDEEMNNQTLASVIISSQIFTDNEDIDTSLLSSVLLDNPIEITFTLNDSYSLLDANTVVSCVYWNFTNNFNSTSFGGWVSDGIEPVIIDNSTIKCLSTHLTSFSVLVDISTDDIIMDNGTDNTTEVVPGIEEQLLSIVSYIGVSVSIVCLSITVIWLLSMRKALFTEVHNFIHLGLAVSLLIALVIFVGGIQFASSISPLCKLIAALLHYFFLSAFCWMLCEAIMLFLLLVIVFSTLSKKWWIFCIIGWGFPLLPVGITMGIDFENYTPNDQICWLNNSNHLIWGFIGPMILIILVNAIVLVVALYKIYKSKKGKGSDKSEARSNVITLIQGAIVLLPLLGLTWIIGVFAIDSNTTAFAWIFTILNSLQGVFIFVFHVLRSKKFTTKMKSFYQRRQKQRKANMELSYSTNYSFTSSTAISESELSSTKCNDTVAKL